MNSDFDLNPHAKTVMFIDFNNLFFRVLYGSSTTHESTFLNSLWALRQMSCDVWVAVDDGVNAKEGRLKLYPEYKANRVKKDWESIEPIKLMGVALCRWLGMHFVVSENGWEADDVIGTLSREQVRAGWNAIVVSSDKDYKQLCSQRYLNVYNSMSKTVTHSLNIAEQTQLTAQQYLDYLILKGDTADNIKGVDKVGDKTAIKWLLRYGSLDNIVKSLDTTDDFIKGKVRENLLLARQNGVLDLNRELIEFKTVWQSVNWDKPATVDTSALLAFCAQHDIKKTKENMMNHAIFASKGEQMAVAN